MTDFISGQGRARLAGVIAWLEAGAPHTEIGEDMYPVTGFHMDQGVTVVMYRYAEPVCGTVCCIAGAICQFSMPFDLKTNKTRAQYFFSAGGVMERARALLGIEFEDAEAMFVPKKHMWNSITEKVAARMLRIYLDTGVVDWSSAGAMERTKEKEWAIGPLV